jgi:hypothetical protein
VWSVPAGPVRGLATREDNDGIPDPNFRHCAAGGIDDARRRGASEPTSVDLTRSVRRWLKAKWLRARKAYVRAFLSYDGVRLLAALRAQDSVDCVMEMASRGDFFYDMNDSPKSLTGLH